MLFCRWPAPLLLALSMVASSPAWASDGGSEEQPQAEPDGKDLEGMLSEKVISSASRSTESANEAPATTWTISGTDLKRYGIASIEEAIRFLGHGMTSYESDGRVNAAFGSRGYMSDNLGLHLAVLIDGNQAGGSAMTARGTQAYMMPIELVDHLEVVIGPGSVLYGNSAMLGVVNVITRSAASMEHTQLMVQAGAAPPSDKWAKNWSWGDAWVRAAAFGAHKWELGGKPFELAWHFAVRWERQQGRSVWHAVSGVDPYENTEGAFVREDAFNRDLRTRLFARANWGSWNFLGWVALSGGSGTGPISGSAASSYLEPEYGLDAKWSTHVGERGDLSIRGYAVVYDTRVNTGPYPSDPLHCLTGVGSAGCVDTVHYLTAKPYLESIFTWDWKKDASHVTTFGAQAFIDGSLITSGIAATDGSKAVSEEPILAPVPNAALFAQHVWRAGFGSLNLGLRGDLGFLGSAISPRAAYSVGLWEGSTLKVIFSTAFRTPTITERYLEIADFLTSNPNIRPERVYSGEVDLGQRLGLHNVQLSVFGAYWEGIIDTHTITVDGKSIGQFANLRNSWSAGVNLGLYGQAGPFDWALSLNYAPGRTQLPRNVAELTNEELSRERLSREAVERYGSSAFGNRFLPTDAMPDFYSTGHVSYSFGPQLPRVSLAANLNSPRTYLPWANNLPLLDRRNLDGAWLPWTLDARAAVESAPSTLGWRLMVTGRTLGTTPTSPRIGSIAAPLPQGGIGTASNPVGVISAMVELYARL
jgi:outer membrane receptor for ferrienterochelin and colicins